MYSLVNLPHTTIMRRIVHNKALNSRLSHLIITYNMTELPHTHMRGSKRIVISLIPLL